MKPDDALHFAPLMPAHLADMVRVERESQPYPWRETMLADGITGTHHIAVGAWYDGELVGFYFADRVIDESTLHNICLLPQWRGRRWGEALLLHYLQQAMEFGCFNCWLEVRRSNLVAKSLYLRVGYQQVGVRKGYYACQDGREDALVMVCHQAG